MERAVLHPATLWSLARETVRGWLADFAPSMGAGIACYTAFSIGPLLVVVIAIAGVAFGADAVSGYVYAQLADLLGASGAQMVRDMAEQAGRTEQGVIAPIVGVVLLLVGATTVFAELKSDLDRIWKAPAAKKPRGGAWDLLRKRVLSLGLVVSVAFVMLVSLVLSAALAALGKWWAGWFEELQWLLYALDFLVSLAAVSLLFALMYKILPSVKIGWRDVWVGMTALAEWRVGIDRRMRRLRKTLVLRIRRTRGRRSPAGHSAPEAKPMKIPTIVRLAVSTAATVTVAVSVALLAMTLD